MSSGEGDELATALRFALSESESKDLKSFGCMVGCFRKAAVSDSQRLKLPPRLGAVSGCQ